MQLSRKEGSSFCKVGTQGRREEIWLGRQGLKLGLYLLWELTYLGTSVSLSVIHWINTYQRSIDSVSLSRSDPQASPRWPPGLCMCCSPAQKAFLSSPCQCIPQSSLVSMFCAICSSFKVLPSVLISPVPSCFACLSSYLRRGKLWGRMWLLYVLNMCMCWNILHEQT